MPALQGADEFHKVACTGWDSVLSSAMLSPVSRIARKKIKARILRLLEILVIPTVLGAQTQPPAMDKKQNLLPAEGRGNPKVEYLGQSIDQMVYEFMEEKEIPGLTLAIVQAPYIPRVVGYGLSDIEHKRLASAKTVWAIGPISQGFAAVAVMQLFEQGKLGLDDRISKYLPGLPPAWKDITVFQLLQHATGIADYRMQKGFDAAGKYSAEDLIAMVRDIPPAFSPGTDVARSATNFLLLAEVVEKAGGMSYHDFVTENQINRLGLKHTLFAEDLPKLKTEDVTANGNRHKDFLSLKDFIDPTESATGYDGQLHRVPVENSAALKGFGDIRASAEDISFWDVGLAGSLLIAKPENRALIYKPTKLDNGKTVPAMAGWLFQHHKGLMDIKGSVPGFSAFLSRFTDPSELVCVTLLANKEGIDFTNLGRRIASAFGKSLQSGLDDRRLYAVESVFSAGETMQRVEDELKKRNIPVFARFDHSQNAKEAGLDLRPTRVIVFGSPAVGTGLMQANQSIAIELPLRISVWEDANGSVWAAFPQMKNLAEAYGLQDNPVVGRMQTLLEEIIQKACSAY